MTCFVTGITGFIGSNLTRRLVADGHTVHATIRGDEPEEFSGNPLIRFFRADLSDPEKLRAAANGCDVGFHLAAFARPWSKDPEYPYRVNVGGTVNVLSAALATGVSKVVLTSSGATISPSAAGLPSDEDTPRVIPYFNSYESTKAEAEKQAREYCAKGLPVVIVNPARVYGPGPLNPSNSVTRMIAGYARGTWRVIPGDGSQIGSYVYIDDVVRGHLLAAERGRDGERYILGGENLTFTEFFDALGRVTGRKRTMLHLPIPAMMAAARFMEGQAKLTGLSPAITTDFVRRYLVHWGFSSRKAERELGYTAMPFAEGAQMTLDWASGDSRSAHQPKR